MAVLDIRSNTMKMGVHQQQLGSALAAADRVLLCENPDLNWDIEQLAQSAPTIVDIKSDTQQIIDDLTRNCQQGDLIVIMSNGGFDNIHRRLLQAMQH